MRIVAYLGLVFILCVAVGQAGCAPAAAPIPPIPGPPTPTPGPPLQVSSAAFEPGGEIPAQYSCQGANLSPPLEWSGVPEGTQSLALVVSDLLHTRPTSAPRTKGGIATARWVLT